MRRQPLCLLPVLLALLSAATAFGADPAVERVLERHAQLRPTAERLAMYQLDWAASLDEALARAKVERRSILLVVIHAQYGDLYSGHC